MIRRICLARFSSELYNVIDFPVSIHKCYIIIRFLGVGSEETNG
jgi:hypothetical protein